MKALSRAFEKFNSHAMYERMTMRQMLTIGGRRPFHAKAHALRNIAKFAAASRAAKEKQIIALQFAHRRASSTPTTRATVEQVQELTAELRDTRTAHAARMAAAEADLESMRVAHDRAQTNVNVLTAKIEDAIGQLALLTERMRQAETETSAVRSDTKRDHANVVAVVDATSRDLTALQVAVRSGGSALQRGRSKSRSSSPHTRSSKSPPRSTSQSLSPVADGLDGPPHSAASHLAASGGARSPTGARAPAPASPRTSRAPTPNLLTTVYESDDVNENPPYERIPTW